MPCKNLVKSLLIIMLVSICIMKISRIVENKIGDDNYGFLVENGDDVDVLFVGSSHMWDGVLPMEIWNKYGIASYNAGYSGNRMQMDYWILRQTLQYCSPELVVIDIYSYTEDIGVTSNYGLHTMLDGFPLSVEKIRAVMDIDETTQGKTDKIDMLFNFCTYHSRWDELSARDFSTEVSDYSRGANYAVGLSSEQMPANDLSIIDSELPETQGYNYLTMTIEYLQDRNIDVLLVLIPQPCTNEARELYNYANVIAEQYGIHYLDLTQVELIDESCDYLNYMSSEDRIRYAISNNEYRETSIYDNNAHLNVSGAYKITDYLGQYICDSYDVSNRSEDNSYDYWNDDWEKWVRMENNTLRSTDDLHDYFVLLSNPHFDVDVCVPDCLAFDDEIIHLMHNAGIEDDGVIVDDSLVDAITVCVMRDGELIDERIARPVFDEKNEMVDAVFLE
ncbi:MAG: hypothetical protein K5871_04875 [Lachnospiraceae bacterium]|nr:hypothetical protein [Lachnospiraceae bacterium]